MQKNEKVARAIRWAFAATGAAILCLLLMMYVDRPVEILLGSRKVSFPSALALDTEPFIMVLDLGVLAYAMRTWRRPSLPEKAVIAITTALSTTIAYALTSFVMKPLFGRLPVTDPGHHSAWWAGFDLWHGSAHSLFPSGHVAVLTATVSNLWCVWPRYRFLYALALLLLSMLLVWGRWHFPSDVIAGAFVGAGVTLAVRALWSDFVMRSQRADAPR